jgi:hypothetical protein
VPKGAQAEVKAAYWQSFDDIQRPPGQAAVDEATRRAAAFTVRYQRTYPAAVACLTSTLSELTVHLRFPAEYWQRIRHTICWNAPSARPAGGPGSPVGSLANGLAPGWSGRSWTARAGAGAARPTPQRPRGSSKISAATCPPTRPPPAESVTSAA